MTDIDELQQKIKAVIAGAENGLIKFKNEDRKIGYILALNAVLFFLVSKGVGND